jgi:quercetin dioxygenase-like cupin family protein
MDMSHEHNSGALRPASGGMLSLKLIDEASRLKAKPEWSSGDRVAASLVKDGALNILLMLLKKGALLAEHRTKGPVAVHVLSGAVRFTAGSERSELSSGSIAALDREVVHALEALEESVILLITTIG